MTGWLFVAPAVLGLVLFLLIPMVLSLWVSFRDWSGLGSPFESEFNGLDNYRELLTQEGIRRQDFAISLRNTFYYVIIVVPAQTMLALFLAFLVNQRFLRGRGGFRTLLYFPSVTAAIAITLIWLVLFRTSGLVNRILPIDDINWFNEPNGLIHNLLGVFGVDEEPSWLSGEVFELSWWEWLSGPSVAMFADHDDDDLDDERHDDADLPRRPAERQPGGRGGGGDRRGDVVQALPLRDHPDAPPAALPRRDARGHRHAGRCSTRSMPPTSAGRRRRR